MIRLFIVAAIALAGYFVWRISLMKLKIGADLTNVSWRMFYAAIVVDGVMRELGSEAIITSGADGKHSARSKHYPENNLSGMVEALDFRTWGIDPESAALRIRNRLGRDYDVVVEATHLHVEYDPEVELTA